MSGAFTPGPWLIERLPHATGFRTFIITEKRVPVATVSSGSNGPGHATANANLIAASPDLYAALERIRKLALSGEGPTFDLILSVADAALTKARGEQSL